MEPTDINDINIVDLKIILDLKKICHRHPINLPFWFDCEHLKNDADGQRLLRSLRVNQICRVSFL